MKNETAKNIRLAFDLIAAEVKSASDKWPGWPDDAVHAATIIAEEAGELQKAVLERVYEPHKYTPDSDIQTEAIQTAAMCIRFLVNMPRYNWQPASLEECFSDVDK